MFPNGKPPAARLGGQVKAVPAGRAEVLPWRDPQKLESLLLPGQYGVAGVYSGQPRSGNKSTQIGFRRAPGATDPKGAQASLMFDEFYGLSEQPFGVTPDPRFLYLGPAQQEAYTSLVYGIQMGRGFMALIAKPGLGKTTFLLRLMEELRETARSAFLFQSHTNSHEFLRSLLADLDIVPAGNDLGDLQRQFGDLLLQEAQTGKRIVVAVDEAQNLSDEVLETIRMLSNFETPRQKLLQIVLAGQPEFATRLSTARLEQLRQRVSIISHFPPLDSAGVSSYIDHRLRVAGYQGEPLFTAEALDLIASHSKGTPRNVNNLCFHALSLGYVKSEKPIGEVTLLEVIADLNVEALGTGPETPKPFVITSNAVAHAPVEINPFAEENSRPVPLQPVLTPLPTAATGFSVLDQVELAPGAAKAETAKPDRGRKFVPAKFAAGRPGKYERALFVLFGLGVLIGCLWVGPWLASELSRQRTHPGTMPQSSSVPASPPLARTGEPQVAQSQPQFELPAPPPTSEPATVPDTETSPSTPHPPTVPDANPPSAHRTTADTQAILKPAVRGPAEDRQNSAPVMAGQGRLVVESSIGSAHISVDNRTDANWITPHIFSLPAGSHLISISKAGYVRWSKAAQVTEGRESYLVANLASVDAEEGGIFTVDTTPPGMQVFIDGRAYGKSRVDTVLRPGWHECTVIPQPGMEAISSRFQIKPGEAVTRRIRMAAPAASRSDVPSAAGNGPGSLAAGGSVGLH